MRALWEEGLALAIGVPLIVFGTYASTGGGMDSSGTVYLMQAFSAAVAIVAALLLRDVFRRGRFVTSGFRTLESQLFIFIFLLIFVSTFGLPQYLKTVVAAMGAGVAGLAFITQHANREVAFRRAFATYQRLVYVTCFLALAGGLYSYHIGPVGLGPIRIEYNGALSYYRMNSWYVTSTALGLFLCHGIYAAYYFGSGTRSLKVKAWHWLFAFGCIYGMALTGGRTGFFILVVTFLVLWFSRNWPPRFSTLIKLAALALAFAGLLAYLMAQFSEEIYVLRRLQGEDSGSLGGRTDFMQHAWSEVSSFSYGQLFFGTGTNGVQEVLKWKTSAHSGMARFMLEYGLTMLLAYGIFAAIVMTRAFRYAVSKGRYRREQDVLLLALCSYFTAEFPMTQLFGVCMEFLMFIATLGFYLALKPLRGAERES